MLIAQMVHTVFPLVIDTLIRLISPYPYHTIGRFIQGKLVFEVPPWYERLLWGQMIIQCIAFIFEIEIWRWISKQKSVFWMYLAVITAATGFYLFGISGTTSELLMPDKYLLCAALFSLVVLWWTRRDFSVKVIHIAEIVASVFMAAVIVFVKGYYFPTGSIQWAIKVPAYVDIIASSGLDSPQETTLVMCVVSFSFIHAIVQRLSTRRLRNEGDDSMEKTGATQSH